MCWSSPHKISLERGSTHSLTFIAPSTSLLRAACQSGHSAMAFIGLSTSIWFEFGPKQMVPGSLCIPNMTRSSAIPMPHRPSLISTERVLCEERGNGHHSGDVAVDDHLPRGLQPRGIPTKIREAFTSVIMLDPHLSWL